MTLAQVANFGTVFLGTRNFLQAVEPETESGAEGESVAKISFRRTATLFLSISRMCVGVPRLGYMLIFVLSTVYHPQEQRSVRIN